MHHSPKVMIRKLCVRLLPAIVLSLTGLRVSAQSKDSISRDTVLPLRAGIDFFSNNVYLGRTSTSGLAILSPNIKYTFGNGIYLGGSACILPTLKNHQFDSGDLSLGYTHSFTDALSGEASFTKSFYNSTSTQIGSSVSGAFNINVEYDISHIITPDVGFDYILNRAGAKSDEVISFGLSHDFTISKPFSDNDEFGIAPRIALNAGTQNFYDAFLDRKVSRNNTKRTKQENAELDEFESGLDNFKMLDYEFSLPLEYRTKHFSLSLTPEYDMVRNTFKSSVAKALDIANKTSVFYLMAGMAFKF